MPNFLKKKWAASSLEKEEGKCIKKCKTVIISLHTIAIMFQIPHFICNAEPEYSKFAYKNYIPKIVYLKLASFNSSFQNERARKL